MLIFYCIGIIGYSQQQVLNRGMYALRDSKRAVIVNCTIIIINIVLSFLMVGPFKAQGLALAYSVAGLVSMVLGKIIIASAAMGAGVLVFLAASESFIDITSKTQQLVELFAAIGIGMVIYVVMAIVLRIKEMQAAIAMMRRKLHR